MKFTTKLLFITLAMTKLRCDTHLRKHTHTQNYCCAVVQMYNRMSGPPFPMAPVPEYMMPPGPYSLQGVPMSRPEDMTGPPSLPPPQQTIPYPIRYLFTRGIIRILITRLFRVRSINCLLTGYVEQGTHLKNGECREKWTRWLSLYLTGLCFLINALF